ncbi:uncharacterized protein N7459_005359 [Penicillium hispanicum]|uniref:uncharacterized protein n=1 Tax=Penicillium hispanicum TaxID=1080232 RepID=UPI002540E0F3|nr:uncharacterized protein N7459_005359 [Penicillium hispanicum]KAJ5585559.1 hypothetical protein N7459_005359 [Penicillium hispanicum]
MRHIVCHAAEILHPTLRGPRERAVKSTSVDLWRSEISRATGSLGAGHWSEDCGIGHPASVRRQITAAQQRGKGRGVQIGSSPLLGLRALCATSAIGLSTPLRLKGGRMRGPFARPVSFSFPTSPGCINGAWLPHAGELQATPCAHEAG